MGESELSLANGVLYFPPAYGYLNVSEFTTIQEYGKGYIGIREAV